MKTFVWLVLANYLLRALLAAGLFSPFVHVVEAAGVGQFPAGDRILFQPSGLYLLELLRLAGSELAALAHGSLWLLLATALASIVARALTYSTLAQRPFELGEVIARALRLVPGYLLIVGLVFLAQVLTLGLFYWLGSELSRPLGARSERIADLVLVGVALLGLFAALLLGAIAELARASLAHAGGGALSAMGRALELCQRFPVRLLSRWAGLGASGVVLVLLGAELSGLIDVSRAGGWRTAGVFTLHQLVALALTALHTAWLAIALGAAQSPIVSR